MERFMELYQTVYQDLYRLAYYYMGNREDAQDMVQDTVLAAYEHFPGLKQEASFRPWIFRILVNRCKSSLRKHGRKVIPVEDCTQMGQEQTSGLSSQAEVLELLDTLKEDERLIVVLSVFGGYKGEEIARLLNKKHSTIRSKYHRALKKLRQELEPEKEMQK